MEYYPNRQYVPARKLHSSLPPKIKIHIMDDIKPEYCEIEIMIWQKNLEC